MRRLSYLVFFCAFLFLSNCAGTTTQAPSGSSADITAEQNKQKELSYQNFIEAEADLYRISLPILSSNAEFCKDRVKPVTGISAWNIHAVPKDFQKTAQSLYALDDRFQVRSVVPASPGDKAGLKPGDIITHINGIAVPEGKEALKFSQKALKENAYNKMSLSYERNGTTQQTSFTPKAACNYPVVLDQSSTINAFADGERIVVTRGIMRFADDENEIAMVISHELAHNTMGHIKKLKQNTLTGSLGGLVVDSLLTAVGVNTGNQFSRLGGALGQQRFSVPFEQEADYVGMYYLARSGYDIDGVANFWRRMASDGQASITIRTTHPASAERFIAIESAQKEIEDKLKRGQPLIPNFTQ